MKEVVWKTWEASHVWIKSKERNSSERIKRPKQLKVEGFELLMVNILEDSIIRPYYGPKNLKSVPTHSNEDFVFVRPHDPLLVPRLGRT
jgi:hypothetical protein